MTYLPYILFLPFFLASLFILYVLSKNDFVLQRKNISVSNVFDYTFFISFIVFIIGRIFYILDSQHYSFFYIISFFHFVKHPGFSILGVLLGAMLGVALVYRDRKILPRVLDIYFLSMFPFYLFDAVTKSYPSHLFFLRIVIPLISLLVFAQLIKLHKNYSVRDGSTALIGMTLVSLEIVLSHFYQHTKTFYFLFSFLEWTSLCVIVCSVVLLILNEELFSKKK